MAISFREMPWYVQVLVFVTLAAIIVGLVAALLALLTIFGVFGGHIVAPATAS